MKYSNISLKKKKKRPLNQRRKKTYPLAGGNGSRDCTSFDGPYSSPTTNKMHVKVV
jgi:hypothetical protein